MTPVAGYADRRSDTEPEKPQALVRIVPRGGSRTPAQIRDQLLYLARKGEVPLQRSERYLGIIIPFEGIEETALHWAEQTGNHVDGHAVRQGCELTTHIVVSFPAGTELFRAFAAGRAWAEEMFGSGKNGGCFDYLTACHSDRPHPHVHVVVNRRAMDGGWLKISRRHAHLNYAALRIAMVEIAHRNGIVLDASSRLERGIPDRPITYAEFRRRARRALP